MSAIRIDHDELKRVAVHESGHAVMAIVQGIQCSGVFLAYEPSITGAIHGGRFCVPCGNKLPWKKSDYLQAAAGAGAEKLFFSKYNQAASKVDRELFSTPGAPEWEAMVDEAKMILSESADAITHMADAIIVKHQQVPMSLWPDRGMDGTSTRFKEILSEEQVRQIVATVKLMQLFRPWPAARPKVGTLVVIPGFQGVHRQIGDGKLTINLTVFSDQVSSSSDRHFVLVDEGQERIVVRINDSLDELGPLGGVSGSPVFTMDSENNATLVGFLYETGEGANAMIFVIHADLLTADGKINHAQIVW